MLSPRLLFASVNVCPYCQRSVPGVEKVCKDCFAKLYAESEFPKPSLFRGLKDWVLDYVRKPIPDPEPAQKMLVAPFGWLLALGTGICLYVVFTLAAPIVAALILIPAAAIISYDICDFSVRRSRTSTLTDILVLSVVVAFALQRLTGNGVYFHIAASACCVGAALILLDRKRVI